MKDMIHFTEKQRKFVKQLIHHIETNDEINCDESGQLIVNDHVCNGSNIYELVCHKIRTSCVESLDRRPNRRSNKQIMNWIKQ